MRDLTAIFEAAKEKCVFLNQNAFFDFLKDILPTNGELYLDWDYESGENWARIVHPNYGIVYTISSKIGIAFVDMDYLQKTSPILNSKCEVVIISDPDEECWFIDLAALKQKIPEVIWHASTDAVDPDHFSLSELFYATM